MNSHSRQYLFSGFLILAVALSGGCVGGKTVSEQGPGALSGSGAVPANTFVYECGEGKLFTVRVEGEVAWLFEPSKAGRLPRVPSGSGAKFSDGSVTYWAKGDEALLVVAGQTYRGCMKMAAGLCGKRRNPGAWTSWPCLGSAACNAKCLSDAQMIPFQTGGA